MKKLIALISPEGKVKEQLVNEAHEAVQKYFRVEKEILNPKKNRKPYLYVAGIIVLVLAGYFYFSRAENAQVTEKQETNTSRPVSPEELKELQKDPSAPAWLKDAKSCTWVGEKIFCKLKGE